MSEHKLRRFRTDGKLHYEYRNVLIWKEGNYFVWEMQRISDTTWRYFNRLKNTTAAIDKALDETGRDWYAKPVRYIAHNGTVRYVHWKDSLQNTEGETK